MQVVQFLRQLEYKIVAGNGILRIPAIDRVSRKHRRIAKIFHPAPTVGTASIHSANPGHAYARAHRQFGRSALYNVSHDLMAGNQRLFSGRQVSFNNVEIGPAYSASSHSKQDLTGSSLGRGIFSDLKRLLRTS